jgi:hypothetical protein
MFKGTKSKYAAKIVIKHAYSWNKDRKDENVTQQT